MPISKQVEHLLRVGEKTRFCKGQNTGVKHPRWKGGGGNKGKCWRLLGVDWRLYPVILALQDGGCAICGRKEKNNCLSLDHDHETGRVRGLLCVPCNRALEHMWKNKDKIELYLQSEKDWRHT